MHRNSEFSGKTYRSTRREGESAKTVIAFLENRSFVVVGEYLSVGHAGTDEHAFTFINILRPVRE